MVSRKDVMISETQQSYRKVLRARSTANMAKWIRAYGAYAVLACCACYPPKSLTDLCEKWESDAQAVEKHRSVKEALKCLRRRGWFSKSLRKKGCKHLQARQLGVTVFWWCPKCGAVCEWNVGLMLATGRVYWTSPKGK